MTDRFSESTVEDAALAWLAELGWAVKHGPDISPDGDPLTLALSQREREATTTWCCRSGNEEAGMRSEEAGTGGEVLGFQGNGWGLHRAAV